MTFWKLGSRRAAAVRLAAAGSVLLLAPGCSALNPGSDEAAAMAGRFHQLLASGDSAAACELLAPGTIEELESGDPGSCAGKLSGLGLATASKVLEGRAYGREAQVKLDGDTVFLTRSGDRWVVTAAGCASRGERPYDCEVKGH
ncbi:hypothetical protein [Arthrobacter mobilis]|uniref:Lipoprotein n=1 Tax=Arthrobacter mobilis TaxID=2724944 RepID=A0A7X6K6B5_9MICC|nr:hypothetical protein [Arthrobacter mobilis]NKX55479.1 hypothetical protein [Arthrobacter mobilis]